MISHNKSQFIKKIKNKKNFIFYKKIKKFNLDPVPYFMNKVDGTSYSFLYESVEKGKDKGRYTFCGYGASSVIINKKKGLYVIRNKKTKKLKKEKNILNQINSIINSYKISNVENLPPMTSAFFGYLSYENINNIENIIKKKKIDTLHLPDCLLFIPETLIIYDNQKSILFLTKTIDNSASNKKNVYENLVNEFKKIEKDVKINKGYDDINFNKRKKIIPKSNISRSKFEKNINLAKKYIKDGDIFQVVPSQRFYAKYNATGKKLYQVLRKTNPSPFLYYFNLPNFNIVGSSPEILVRLRKNIITIRPIAGTRPRGKSKEKDKFYERELLKDKKEVSEHLMLLDLGRNDVGRVSRKSSVKVTSSFTIEKYSHVMHIVSNVQGQIQQGKTSMDALMAGFPAGTVTGAPKIRAMEIIDELENIKRGIYAGGIGYISPNGDMDTCIALRTGIIHKNKLYVQAGGGIVYDSDPKKEFEETVNKAKALFNAAEIALGN
tara:strand:- start:113 stop:1591 length:1479 start_codon:yes stop_codon:yes gene_type:complete